ncbi:hypothetical protein D9M68_914780 [compost metagenome]
MLIVDPATGAMFDLPKKASATMREAPVPQPAVASADTSSYGMGKAQWQEQQLNELAKTPMSYEEYQRRYRQIMGQ